MPAPPVTLPLTVAADAAGRVTVDLGPDHAGRRVEVRAAGVGAKDGAGPIPADDPRRSRWPFVEEITEQQRRARLAATVERENARRRAAGLPVAADLTEEEYRAHWDDALAAGPLAPPPEDWDEPMEEPLRWCD